ncbi:hypothetical protein DOTSEDRAFT_72024, partial [Dothistroma septosporum NZE10]
MHLLTSRSLWITVTALQPGQDKHHTRQPIATVSTLFQRPCCMLSIKALCGSAWLMQSRRAGRHIMQPRCMARRSGSGAEAAVVVAKTKHASAIACARMFRRLAYLVLWTNLDDVVRPS